MEQLENVERCPAGYAESVAESFGGVECCLYATAIDVDKGCPTKRQTWMMNVLRKHGWTPYAGTRPQYDSVYTHDEIGGVESEIWFYRAVDLLYWLGY